MPLLLDGTLCRISSAHVHCKYVPASYNSACVGQEGDRSKVRMDRHVPMDEPSVLASCVGPVLVCIFLTRS